MDRLRHYAGVLWNWDHPYLLNTQEKVDEANAMVEAATLWSKVPYRLGDHCPFKLVTSEEFYDET
jgi:hypothetical protein